MGNIYIQVPFINKTCFMKARTFICTGIVLFSVTLASAQETLEENAKKPKKIAIKEVYLSSGFLMERTQSISLENFRNIAPSSVLLSNDFSDYNNLPGHSTSSNSIVALSMGIKFNNNEETSNNNGPTLRIGFNYASNYTYYLSYYKEERKPYDTLVSTQTGQTYYVDSVTNKNYRMSYTTNQLRLETSLIFHTEGNSRWSLFGGLGISAGLSFNNKTSIQYFENGNTSTYYGGSNADFYTGYPYNHSSARTNENFKNKSGVSAYVFFPMGVDFRIGKNNAFWQKVHFFYELRPSFTFNSMPEYGGMLVNSGLFNGIGVKINWN